MSYVRITVYSFECDAEGCNELSGDVVPPYEHTNKVRWVRESLACDGWQYTKDGRDLCPRHRQEA